jgi:chromosome segregation ATPase
MSWGSDHSHRGEYAEERHDHREIQDEVYDREREIRRVEDELRDRISDVSRDANSGSEEIWSALDELQSAIDRIEKQLVAQEQAHRAELGEAYQRISALEGGSHA